MRKVCRDVWTSYVQPAAPACGPVEGVVRPSLGFHCNRSNYILTTCPYFDNRYFDIGCPQIHFIMSVTVAVMIRTLSVH